MKIPNNFIFSQNNLQDYQDCPRRFYLRHLLKQDWPAVETEPVQDQEKLIALGERFHLMVQQYFAGLPNESISAGIENPILMEWWNQFIAKQLLNLPGMKISENSFTIPFESYRLTAKIDLLLIQEDKQIKIYDWKTSQHTPRSKWLAQRLQTRVYPFVISVLLPSFFPLGENNKEQIEMIYWYPSFPDFSLNFPYSQESFLQDQEYLSNLVNEISSKDGTDFLLTNNEKMCKYCRYRSLCDRGITAGNVNDLGSLDDTDNSAFDIDLDTINLVI
jgi:hypothetical protein